MANLGGALKGASRVDALMSGAGGVVKLCALTCLAEPCKAGMIDAVTTDGGIEGKQLHWGRLSREDAAMTAGGKVELDRLRFDDAVGFGLCNTTGCGNICGGKMVTCTGEACGAVETVDTG